MKPYLVIHERKGAQVHAYELQSFYPACTLPIANIHDDECHISFVDEFGRRNTVGFYGKHPPGTVIGAKIEIFETGIGG